RVCAQSSNLISPLVRSVTLSSLWSENATVCGAISFTGRLATDLTSTMRNGAANAAAATVPARTEPNRTLRRRIEPAVSVDPVVPEVVRIDPALRLLELAIGRRLARPAAEQAALVRLLLVGLLLLIRRLRRAVVGAAARAAVVAIVV